jgi:hypothetical protein
VTRVRRLLLLGASLLAALGVVVPAASAAVGFGLAPLSVTVEAKPGAKSSYELTVTNTDEKAATYTFGKVDIQGSRDDPDATPVLLPGKQASSISGYDWLSVPAAVTIPAGGTRKVSVDVSVPSDATGGHYAALIVTGPARSAGQIVATSRIAVPFLMNAGGTPPPEIKITDVKEIVGGGTKIVYENNGTTAVKPKPTIHYIDPITHKPITKTTGNCSTALPGGSGSCTVGDGTSGGSRDGAKKHSRFGATGGYVDLVTEQGTRARSELPTEWTSAWSSMLLPLAGLVMAVLYFVFLRRRRREDDDVDDELDDDLVFG